MCLYVFDAKNKETFKDINVDILKLKAFELLTEDRKAQKYTLMCYLYNEAHLSRTARWKSMFETKFGITVDDQEYKLLSQFSIRYEQFLDTVFPKLVTQLKLLDEEMLTIVKKDRPVQIDTLDGCLIEWILITRKI